jgi:F-type H+-transporting ATPase subunit b
MNEENASQHDGMEILDATQNAVIEAVDNVSGLITETHQPEVPTAHHEAFYQEAEFWVGAAFILVVVALVKPVGSALKKMLVNYRNNVADSINQAEKLRDDAQELLAKYERMARGVDKEVQSVLDKAVRQAAQVRTELTEKTDQELRRKTKETDHLIEAAQSGILSEINGKAATKAVATAHAYLAQRLTRADHEKLIDDSIENILDALKKRPETF